MKSTNIIESFPDVILYLVIFCYRLNFVFISQKSRCPPAPTLLLFLGFRSHVWPVVCEFTAHPAMVQLFARRGYRLASTFLVMLVLLLGIFEPATAVVAKSEASAVSNSAADSGRFIGKLAKLASKGAKLANNAGDGTAPEMEACFTCNYILRRAYVLAGKANAGADDIAMAIVAACDDIPPVLKQGCETLVELKKRVSIDLRSGTSFEDACENVQLCWTGLMVG